MTTAAAAAAAAAAAEEEAGLPTFGLEDVFGLPLSSPVWEDMSAVSKVKSNLMSSSTFAAVLWDDP